MKFKIIANEQTPEIKETETIQPVQEYEERES